MTLAEVADDLSSVTLTLSSFSGNGAGPAAPRTSPTCPARPTRL